MKMQTTNKKPILVLLCLLAILLSSGCTNWKRKHEICAVELSGCQGQLDYEKDKRGALERDLTEGQRTIAELQRQIDEQKRTPGQVLGLEGYEVDFDPRAGTITVTLPNTILFASGAASLKNATSTDLNHIESVLESRYPSRQIDVVGHTDTDPIKATKDKWKDNLELSAQRALTVVRYLIKRGIPEKNIRAVGCGAARPVASNATPSGKAKNRRVEIVVYMR
jgi:chemotaxis protein MotB